MQLEGLCVHLSKDIQCYMGNRIEIMFSFRGLFMTIMRNLSIVILAVVLTGCAKIDPNLKIEVSKAKNPWTNLNLYNNPDNFQFAIVSDRNGGNRPGIFEQAVKKINLLKPEFVISVGDLIEGYTEDEAKIDSQWDEFDYLVERLEMPFFYIPGNHDVTNRVMEKKWQQRHGALYYHFIYHDVLFIFLNSENPPQGHEADNISLEQIEYFKKVLDRHQNLRWTLVFMHKPMWLGGNGKNETWPKMEKLLDGRKYTVFAGHHHTYNRSIRNGHQYFVLATTGGGKGENNEPGGLDKCQFDHIVWVTMTDAGPVITNLLLDGILDDQPCKQ